MRAVDGVGPPGRRPDDRVELVVDGHALVGEGPTWDAVLRCLLWTDILGHAVHVFDPTLGVDRQVAVEQPVGAIVPRAGGGHVVAIRDGFATVDLASGRLEMLAAVERAIATNRMNDGKCDRHGRFWAGTMADDATVGRGALYRLDPDHRVTRILGDITISNGIAWSADDRTMYYVDTGRDRIDAFDFDPASGTVDRRRTLVAFDPSEGRPDGITVDAEGALWVAFAGGWCIRRYRMDGVLDQEVALPVRLVTSCAFGGDDLGDLYVTSGSYDVAPDDLGQPHAGGLFRFRPGVAGVAPSTFQG